ncbi:ATP synthase subunit d, mitochondrial-like [Anneissia japonica]|uniref:ATP synthase subunit d, mitochondrial-like n=1 Tax=Anneissia japonica TaxID=1529436 RepID=UPI00142581D2|nr:ATP synthase subunit d, mitochondrial-like [Anneissia japonica]
MAAKRAAKKAVDWAAFAERVPVNQKSQFNALKGKSDAIRAKFMATPEKPPAIDWAYYKARVTVPGLVDKFQKQFADVKVPFPQENVTGKIDEQEKLMDKQALEFKAASEARIAKYEKEITKLNGMIPFEEMTIEEYVEYFPESAENLKKYPWWPHIPIWEQKA